MANFTKPITVAGWIQLGAVLTAAGYTGTYALSSLEIINDNAETVYIHLTDNGDSSPEDLGGSSTDGIAIGTAEASIEWSAEQQGEDFIDAGTTWLYAASPVTVKAVGIGGGV